MAAKLLHSLADDNPDLQNQIGCVTGIFHPFDRQHIVTGRRISQKKLPLPPGNSYSNSGYGGREFNAVCHGETGNTLNEKQSLPTESSRASFSSSCSSSLSSMECNKTTQLEASSFDRVIFSVTPLRGPIVNHSRTSPILRKESLNLREVVKDSMHRDSPRQSQPFKSSDKYSRIGKDRKQGTTPADLDEALRVLAKLQGAPMFYNEYKEHPRSSYEAKHGTRNSNSRDFPRFSCDGREINRLSFESRETIRSSIKLKELPRLSLDSRENSMRSSNSVSISRHDLPESSGTQKRPPSVVAKLMGLEALPDPPLACNSQLDDPFTKASSARNQIRPVKISDSPENSSNGQMKNPNVIMKPVSSSKFPIETAPWRQLDENSRYSRKSGFRPLKSLARTPSSNPSVYSEIEKRLKDLEFKQSGKNLRALKQILEAMQTKGLLETRKEAQASNVETQRDEPKCATPHQNINGGPSSLNAYESPIVVMKPAKLVEKSNIQDSSVIRLSSLLGPQKLLSKEIPDGKRSSSSIRKDKSPRNYHKNSGLSSTEKKPSSRNGRPPQSTSQSQQCLKENTTSSIKSSGSVSPRLQQKKLELEKQSRLTTPDSSKPRRKLNKQVTDSSSKLILKSSNLPQSDDQLGEISNESRTLSYHGDDMLQQSDSNLSLDSKIDSEVSSLSLPLKPAKNLALCSIEKNSTLEGDRDGSLAELLTIGLEHPSPVSVLDASVYKDDEPSPVKQISYNLEGDTSLDSSSLHEVHYKPTANLLTNSSESGSTLEINRKKLQNINNLVQKLRRLNSQHDEAKTDYIASLCENTDPDHRYISEILLASGLLLRDLSSDLTTFQLHPSGHPINPELFFVLEQTRASSLLPKEYIPSPEKLHRKLIFDAVNDILAKKLDLVATFPEPWSKNNKITKKTLSAQKYLKELCFEIHQFQGKKTGCIIDDEEDSLKNILTEDVMMRSGNWTVFNGEIPGVVLDVERSIFKDLANEIVIGDGAYLQAKSLRGEKFAK